MKQAKLGRYIFNNGTRDELMRSSFILHKGELAIEWDTGRMKTGDGINFYRNLPYMKVAEIMEKDIVELINTSNKSFLKLTRGSVDLEGNFVSYPAQAYTKQDVEEGDSLQLLDDTLEMAIGIDGQWVGGWISEDYVFNKSIKQVPIRVRKKDGTVLEIDGNLLQFTKNTGGVATKKDMLNIMSKSTDLIKSELLEYFNTLSNPTLSIAHGNIHPATGEVIPVTSLKEAYVKLDVKKGDTLKILDETLEIAIGVDGKYANGGWADTDFTFQIDCTAYVRIRKKDGTVVDIEGEQLKLVEGEDTDVKKVKYVTLTGSDDNDGNTEKTAYGTMQKALNSGAETVYIQRGVYNQSFTTPAGMERLSIIPLNSPAYVEGKATEKVVFNGAIELKSLVEEEGLYTQSLIDVNNYKKFFVDKSLPLMTESTRPQYYALLWESKDGEIDYLLKPVLTKQECLAEIGTFYWDGAKVYINPLDSNNSFYAPMLGVGGRIENIKELTMTDISFSYFMSSPLIARNVNSFNLTNVDATHSAYYDGFSLNYSTGILNKCDAIKNKNDGFNIHFTGSVIMNNCRGINNYDDGASPHENCVMTVNGGEYRGNGKGGISPASGGAAYVYNAILKSNKFGIYNSRAAANNISSGNLYVENECAVYNNFSEGFVSINDKFINNIRELNGDEFVKY